MPNNPALVTESELEKIEAVMAGDDFEAKYLAASIDNVVALCQSLRAAWAERDEAIKARDLFVSLKRGQTERADKLYTRGLELLSENAALRDQLAQAESRVDDILAALRELFAKEGIEVKESV